MSACFQTEGNFCSLYEEFRMSVTGSATSSAYSFITQFDRPSGPGACACLDVSGYQRPGRLALQGSLGFLRGVGTYHSSRNRGANIV